MKQKKKNPRPEISPAPKQSLSDTSMYPGAISGESVFHRPSHKDVEQLPIDVSGFRVKPIRVINTDPFLTPCSTHWSRQQPAVALGLHPWANGLNPQFSPTNPCLSATIFISIIFLNARRVATELIDFWVQQNFLLPFVKPESTEGICIHYSSKSQDSEMWFKSIF